MWKILSDGIAGGIGGMSGALFAFWVFDLLGMTRPIVEFLRSLLLG